jgi:cystathionine gamma-lyase
MATPLRLRPLEHGADLTVVSASKHLTGHSDLVLGYVATRDPARAQAIRAWRGLTGAIPGPFEVWLAHRSLPTMAVRLERQEATVRALVELLQAHPVVTDVRWPGIGAVLVFTLADADAAERLLGSLKLVAEATSFGGVHSTAERRARWGTDDLPDGFIRFSAGIEDTADLVADLRDGLDAVDIAR